MGPGRESPIPHRHHELGVPDGEGTRKMDRFCSPQRMVSRELAGTELHLFSELDSTH